MKKVQKLSKYLIAFIILAVVFLGVGLGTLGSVQTTGDSYLLMNATKEQGESNVIFKLSNPKDKDGKSIYCSLSHVYLNIAILYSEEGEDAQIRMNRGASASSFSTSSSYQYTAALENFKPDGERDEKTTAIENCQYSWIDPFEANLKNVYKLSSRSYYKLTAPTHNLLINEIVFVGEVLRTKNADGTFGEIAASGVPSGEFLVLPTEIHSATQHNNQSAEDAKKAAGALIDSQRMPKISQSSYRRFTKEEIYTLSSIAEMKKGNSYEDGSVYHGDTVHNTFGTSLVAFGTVMFGMSPFGLRFMPMLFSFGVLVLGFFIARDMFKSDKAGFAFALLYALSGLSIGIGHLGSALMIGVFFFLGAFYGTYRFYRHGLKKNCVSLILAGLSGAAAICVNGAYLIPMLGVCGLFAAGMLKQQRARRYYLDAAIEQAETEEAVHPVPAQAAEGAPVSEARKKVQSVTAEYRRKNTAAPVAFFASLIVGAIFLSLIFLIPTYYLAVKLFDNPASPSLNFFTLGAKFFAGGFVGTNGSPSAWLPAYTVFTGAGETFAITSVVINVFAFLAGLAGIAYAIRRIIVLCKSGKDFYRKAEFVNVTGLLSGIVICLVTVVFAKGAIAFLLLAYLFAFLLAAETVRCFTAEKGKIGSTAKIACIVGIALLVAWFALTAIFTFSIPLPASFMKAFL